MHARIAELLEYLESQNESLRMAFESVPPELRCVRPAPDRWSPAEIVHHLTIVERRLTGRLTELIEQARTMPPEHETAPLFPMVSATRVESRVRRVSASQASEPRDTSSDASRVWEDFLQARQELKAVIAAGDGLRLGIVSAPHPALGDISAYEWIAFAGAHVARHADQMRELST
jgi:hypothetical protein